MQQRNLMEEARKRRERIDGGGVTKEEMDRAILNLATMIRTGAIKGRAGGGGPGGKEVCDMITKYLGSNDWLLGTAAEVITDVNAAAAIAMTGTLSVAGVITALLGYIKLPEITTPAAVADFGTFYTKSDNKMYFQDGAGVEHEVAIDNAGTVTLPGILAVTGAISGTDLTLTGDLITATKTPSAANDTGTAGTICADANFIYYCVSTDTWLRAAIATW